jgi:hypothetical protein
VISTRQMNDDLRALREHPPRLVVALEPPPHALVVHRVMRNQTRLPQEDFWAQMDGWVADGTYRLVRSIAVPGDARNDAVPVTQDIVIENADAVGLSLEDVEKLAGGVEVSFRGDEMRSVSRRGVGSGEVVSARGTDAEVRALSTKLGLARGAPRSWNTVNVYVRADAP